MAGLATRVREWARDLGFRQCGIAGVDLSTAEARLVEWLDRGFHGEMAYMARHGVKRSRPGRLLPGTIRVISVRMDYLPAGGLPAEEALARPDVGYVSRYALGRDYHKLMRRRLQRLADRMRGAVGEFGYRAFVDSAPVLEKSLAEQAGLGWIGKHSNLINRTGGSWFFLGELYTDLPLPVDDAATGHCGTCVACLDACPTGAIVAPYVVDARRCISYLTIELRGPIPEELRPLVGNRIFGCDDCQLVCPWNRFARVTGEPDFEPRQGLDGARLVDLFRWQEDEFYRYTEGSAIRRIGYPAWLRNIAVALGNAETSADVVAALSERAEDPSPLVREHVAWALARHRKTATARGFAQ